jgi:hypothetical protein
VGDDVAVELAPADAVAMPALRDDDPHPVAGSALSAVRGAVGEGSTWF